MSWKDPKWWEYLIPGYGQALATKDLFQGRVDRAALGALSFIGQEDTTNDLQSAASIISDSSRDEYLEDREHTEMREDTAYQRAVADMKAAGLNPYTVGASPAASSASHVGENTLTNQLEILGYMLDLKNLDLKNKQVANQAIGNILNVFKVSTNKYTGSSTSSSTLKILK